MDYETAKLVHQNEMSIKGIPVVCQEGGEDHPATENCTWYDESVERDSDGFHGVRDEGLSEGS